MRPENVLSEVEIRERFKFSRVRHYDEEDENQPLQSAPPSPHPYNTHPYQGSTLPHPGSTHSYPYPSHMMPHPHFHQFTAPSPASPVPAPASPPPPPCYIRVSVIQKAPQSLKVETPSPVNSDKECCESMEQQSDTEITSSSSDSDTNKDSDTCTHKRVEDFCAVAGSETDKSLYDFLILNYVHKKFKRSIVDSGTTVDNECPKDEEDMKVESGTPEGEGDLIISNLGDSMDLDINVSDLESLMYLLTPNLENLETERTLVVEMRNTFDACWRSINFGEKAWSAYIDFCAGKACMDPRIWSFAFLQVRYKSIHKNRFNSKLPRI